MTSWVLEHVVAVSIITILILSLGDIAVFRYIHRLHPDNPTRSALASLVVNIIPAVLISLWLNNLFALRRDLNERIWALRLQHLARLRPVLHKDAQNLEEIAKRAHFEARVTDATQQQAVIQAAATSLWEPDVMSSDLREHFPEYYQEKEKLRAEVEAQDRDFRDVFSLVEPQVRLFGCPAHRTREISLAILQKCLGRGPGVTLHISPGGFSYSSPGGAISTSGNAKPWRDILSAVRAFRSFKPDPELLSRCEGLRQRAEAIQVKANNLSKESTLLAEQNTLKGSCPFVRIE